MPRLKLHPKQRQIKAEARRFNVVDWGRRGGKTIFGQDLLLGPSQQGYPVGWFSPTYKMMTEPWQATKEHARAITVRRSEQEHRIELAGGGVIEMWSLDTPDTARGRKYKRVVIDEAALVPDVEGVFHSIIRPMLADYRGDAWFFSTPKGHNGFYNLWQRGQDRTQDVWRSWQFTTYDNPYIARAEVDAMRAEMPEIRFRQEIMAEFVDDGGLVYRHIVEAATACETPYAPGHSYVMGVDLARKVDFTVCSVLDLSVQPYAMVAMDRFNQVDWQVQRGRIGSMAERYHTDQMVVDQTGVGDPVVEQLRRDLGVSIRGVQFTNAVKANLVESLALAFERGTLTILNDPVLIGELQSFEMERLPSGLVRYNAPDGLHDDCVSSLMLAYSAAEVPSGASLAAVW